MICITCKVAGHLMAAGEDPVFLRSYHACCPGGNWCDCAHKTTPCIRQEPAISTVLTCSIGAANE